MLFSLLFLTFIATTLVRITVANNFLDDPNNTNLFLDLGTDQLPSDSSSLWDADVGLGDPYTDSTFLTDSDSVALNNDQTNSFELAELGDSCEVPPSKRARRDTSPRICTPSDRQGQDQSIVNQLTIPNLLDVFKPKKKQPDRELLGDPPFGASPTGEDGNPCPVEHPLHLCCLDSEMRWAGIENVHISYFALYLCEPASYWGQCLETNQYEGCCTGYIPGYYSPRTGRRNGFDCIVIKYPTSAPPLEGSLR